MLRRKSKMVPSMEIPRAAIPLSGTVKIPEGYAYSNGTLTAKATITVVANNATKKQLPTDTIVQYGRIESYTEIDKEIKADST